MEIASLTPETVERDQYGSWTHSQLPDFGEYCKNEDLKKWAEEMGVSLNLHYMDHDIDTWTLLGNRFLKMEIQALQHGIPIRQLPQVF